MDSLPTGLNLPTAQFVTTDLRPASRLLTLLLRHRPEKVGLQLDERGWAVIEDLERLTAARKTPLTRALIEEITRTSDKQRFKISEDGRMIRASHGHSVVVDLGLVSRAPPETLYHGTSKNYLEAIAKQGLLKGSRQYVHLSSDRETALHVGKRHGIPIVLCVNAGAMHRTGIAFYLSENGVWLTDAVAPRYLRTEQA